ncbi:MAG: kinetochore-associated Ndc80 complex subunit spc25 [Thelocarpon superellum]|nr:MAG: kinetochore-associated Ndc80 complex subunit spc25 [Thelocarpon superellum]
MSTTLFESSLSMSAMRPPLTSAAAPSMADSLPTIKFGFDELRERMARFTTRFDDFIEQGRKRVLEERNAFRMNVAELHEDQRMKKKDIEILTQKSAMYSQSLQKEAQETAEMHAAIATVKAQRDDRAVARDRLRQQIGETKKLIEQRLESQRQHAQHLESQARFNRPELEFWQEFLCLRIEGAGLADRLKFVYTHVDERDWEKEAWFELGMGKREYEVLHCRPKVATEAIDGILERLNQSRDLAVFLKQMRELFVQALK